MDEYIYVYMDESQQVFGCYSANEDVFNSGSDIL